MQPELLPLFPLNLVLFPGAQLPLHIFEERYKEMIGEVVRDKTEFGVVLATEKGIANTGCTAVITQVYKTYDDGRMDVLVAGRRRFEIHLLNDERSFLRGDISFFDDEADEDAAPALRHKVAELGKRVSEGTEFEEDARQLSFHIGQVVQDLETRQVLLSMRSEKERLELLEKYLPQYMERKKLVDHVRAMATKNGHSRHLRGMVQ